MSLFGRVRRQAARASEPAIDELAGLFEHQLEVIRSPARFKAILAGRRAGKTIGAVRDFAHGMRTDPGSLNLYGALTIGSAREIMWQPLRQLSDDLGLGLKFDESKLIASHPNGSRLLVRGTENVRELEKVRGMKFRRIRLDECGAQRPSYLRYLVEDVLTPTLMDDARSDLWLMGTCTRQAYGYFHDITTGLASGWSVFRWTARENPYVDWQEFLYGGARGPGLLELRGWTEDHPTFQREWLARWVSDDTDHVFRFDQRRNRVEALPQLYPGDRWRYVMAADFGVGHHTACVVLAHPRNHGRDTYVVATWQETGLAPSDAAVKLRATWDRWRPDVFVGDIGGLGKAYQAEWNRRFPEIAMVAADKAQKRAALEFTSDALYTAVSSGSWHDRRGLMVLAGHSALEGQMLRLLWDEDRADIAQGQDDDLAMALVYGFRACPAFANADPVAPPPWDEDSRGGFIHGPPHVRPSPQATELEAAFRPRHARRRRA